jgi:hypothetical protein
MVLQNQEEMATRKEGQYQKERKEKRGHWGNVSRKVEEKRKYQHRLEAMKSGAAPQ